jgi:hypothetical protein
MKGEHTLQRFFEKKELEQRTPAEGTMATKKHTQNMLPASYKRIDKAFVLDPNFMKGHGFSDDDTNATKEFLRLIRKELWAYSDAWTDHRDHDLFRLWLNEDSDGEDSMWLTHRDGYAFSEALFAGPPSDNEQLPYWLDEKRRFDDLTRRHSELIRCYFRICNFLSLLERRLREECGRYLIIEFGYGHRLLIERFTFAKIIGFLADLFLEVCPVWTKEELEIESRVLDKADWDENDYWTYRSIGMRVFTETLLLIE